MCAMMLRDDIKAAAFRLLLLNLIAFHIRRKRDAGNIINAAGLSAF